MMLTHQQKSTTLMGKQRKLQEIIQDVICLQSRFCYEHHREGSNNEMYVSRHPFKAEFVKRYGTEMYLLEKTKELL